MLSNVGMGREVLQSLVYPHNHMHTHRDKQGSTNNIYHLEAGSGKNTKKLSKNCSTFPLLFPPHLLPSFHITHTFIHLNGTISKASCDNDSNHEGEAITDLLSRILGSLGVRIYS